MKLIDGLLPMCESINDAVRNVGTDCCPNRAFLKVAKQMDDIGLRTSFPHAPGGNPVALLRETSRFRDLKPLDSRQEHAGMTMFEAGIREIMQGFGQQARKTFPQCEISFRNRATARLDRKASYSFDINREAAAQTKSPGSL